MIWGSRVPGFITNGVFIHFLWRKLVVWICFWTLQLLLDSLGGIGAKKVSLYLVWEFLSDVDLTTIIHILVTSRLLLQNALLGATWKAQLVQNHASLYQQLGVPHGCASSCACWVKFRVIYKAVHGYWLPENHLYVTWTQLRSDGAFKVRVRRVEWSRSAGHS